MESLAQMLEDYRNGEQEFPSYDKLVKVSAHIKLIEKQLIELSAENRKLQIKVAKGTSC